MGRFRKQNGLAKIVLCEQCMMMTMQCTNSTRFSSSGFAGCHSDPPAADATDEVNNVYLARKTQYSTVQCAILYGLESELHKRFENSDPHDIVRELKLIFETHAAVESYEASEKFFNCKMKEGSSVSEHVLKMSGHANKLQSLGIVIPNALGIYRVL